MKRRFDCTDPDARRRGLSAAHSAVQRGELVVLPTDTVYGIGADAFSPAAVQRLLEAKGRGRAMPPPVLVPEVRTLDGLATAVTFAVRELVDAFWPGPLTIVCRAQPSLTWDLGDTHGTVAVRMPLHPVALELLSRTGPMAVSSANLSGRPAATTGAEAEEQLGDSVSVYLEAGPAEHGEASTIVDATTGTLRILRLGALSEERLREVVPDGWAEPESEPESGPDEPAGGATTGEQERTRGGEDAG
ncbi:tRNA threonylcarbamoyl adenosine modification protein (Sua5/YciO/YrdC/YwlC family) [Kineococcus xinjiangensis]|uniref:L-threonylcarbamoyladenylate synthase n=1 Tax=Kineococcus xinjiangensis TaxID=512762 RepID=A0A2S6IWD3_9ACTN|nr:L-threonylcarbamoyladenylate synthase [Kineococcus xinjiangensis]PPK98667.1 tRNA threonylcarbamoyl adenosine modification protein (Sua5/YciO/YrdC/YwlC family) [Kineococcus xinjiangensis]